MDVFFKVVTGFVVIVLVLLMTTCLGNSVNHANDTNVRKTDATVGMILFIMLAIVYLLNGGL